MNAGDLAPYLREVPPGSKAVLLALWTYADPGDAAPRVWPSVDTLAAALGLAPRSVRTCLRKLEAVGAIRSDPRSGRSTVYHLRRPGVVSLRPLNTDPGSTHPPRIDESGPVDPPRMREPGSAAPPQTEDPGSTTPPTPDPGIRRPGSTPPPEQPRTPKERQDETRRDATGPDHDFTAEALDRLAQEVDAAGLRLRTDWARKLLAERCETWGIRAVRAILLWHCERIQALGQVPTMHQLRSANFAVIARTYSEVKPASAEQIATQDYAARWERRAAQAREQGEPEPVLSSSDADSVLAEQAKTSPLAAILLRAKGGQP